MQLGTCKIFVLLKRLFVDNKGDKVGLAVLLEIQTQSRHRAGQDVGPAIV